MPYKLAIKKITIGLLREFSNTMVLPPGQKTGPRAIVSLYLCSTTSSCYSLLLTNKTARSLNLLAKQNTKIRNAWLQTIYWPLREEFMKNLT
jgi:hypothetical protein